METDHETAGRGQGRPRGETRGETGTGPGLCARAALRDFSAAFLDKAECRAYLLSRLHPDGPGCPHCHEPVTGEARTSRWADLKKLQCPECGRWFSAASGTILAGSKLDLRAVVLLAVLLGLGQTTGQVAGILGVSAETVRVWKGRLNG